MTLLPPNPSETKLELKPAEEPEIVTEEKSVGMLPDIEPERKQELVLHAQSYVSEVVKTNPNAPEFSRYLKEVETLASKEVEASSLGSSSILERRSTSLNSAKRSGNNTQEEVSKTLVDLRNVVEELTPTEELTTSSKILGFIPGGNKLKRYFHKYESSQGQLNAIEKALLQGQDMLLKDNAALETEKTNLWNIMIQLNEYITFAGDLDAELVKQVANLKTQGRVEDANKIETELLFAVRQRRQDLITQLTVSIQSYLTMDLIRSNNKELVKGVDRARNTTMYALKTAVIAAQALANQKLVLDQIDALNTATNNTIARTGEMLRQNAAQTYTQAVSSGVSVDTLRKAFDDIYATIDEIDQFKQSANDTMENTINALSEQIVRAKPALERAQNADKSISS